MVSPSVALERVIRAVEDLFGGWVGLMLVLCYPEDLVVAAVFIT